MFGLGFSAAEAINILLTAMLTVGIAWWFNRDVLRGLRTLARGVEETTDRERLYTYDDDGNLQGVVVSLSATSTGRSSDQATASVDKGDDPDGGEETAGLEDSLELKDDLKIKRDRPNGEGESE